MGKTTRGRPKSHRIFKATPSYFFGHTADKEVAAEKRATRKKVRLNNTARASAYAIEQRKREEAEASLRASRLIALESARRKEAASYLPPLASRTTRKSRVSPNMDIEAALADEARKEEEREERLEQRKEKAKETKRLFEKTQKAKKERKERIRLEKKYGLSHVSPEPIEKERYEELLAKGVPKKEAKTQAEYWAIVQTDAKMRKLKDPATKWGDFMMNETPPKEVKKAVAKKLVVPEASIVAPSYAPRMRYAKVASHRPARVDYKKIVVLGLPTETRPGQLDIRELRRKVYSALTGKHIFKTKPDPVIVGIAKRGNYTETGKGLFRAGPSRADGPNKVTAFVTFPTHEDAKKVVEAHRAKYLTIKGAPIDIQPSRREDEMEKFIVEE
jgi:hypothetical protein